MSEGKATIGLVEDPYVLKSALVDLLNKAGYTPLVVARSEDPVKKFETAKPAIIITDRDPATSDHPFGIIDAIRKSPVLGKTEIFFFSDNLDVKDEVALRRFKINSFFLKSADPQTLIDGIRLQLNPPKEETYQEWEDQLLNRGQVIVERQVQVPGPAAPAAPPPPAPAPQGGGGLFGDAGGGSDDMGGIFDSIFGVDDTDKSAKGHFDLGSALFKSKIWDQSLVELRMAANAPKYACDSYLMMGKAYRELGKLPDAVRTFQAGHKLAAEGQKNEFSFELGATMEQAGKPVDAYRLFVAVYKADQNYPGVKERLTNLKKQLPAQEGA
ncbi:MAG: hypothetical protein HQK87_07985 [Nitrospinae bacterium]|nr:hypothetical protein [Nitrospinota bacterium]